MKILSNAMFGLIVNSEDISFLYAETGHPWKDKTVRFLVTDYTEKINEMGIV